MAGFWILFIEEGRVSLTSSGSARLDTLSHHTHTEAPTWQLPLSLLALPFSLSLCAKDLYRELGTVTAHA